MMLCLSTRMDIKTTLSIPSTISRARSVRKATQISGFSNKSTRPTSPFSRPTKPSCSGSFEELPCPPRSSRSLRKSAPGLVEGTRDFHPLPTQEGGPRDYQGRDRGGDEQERRYQDRPEDDPGVARDHRGDAQRDHTEEHGLAHRVQLGVGVGHAD